MAMYYPIAAGSHALGVITSPRGHGLLNCDGKSPGPTTTVSREAGRRYVGWLYGQPREGIRVAVAPIAGP